MDAHLVVATGSLTIGLTALTAWAWSATPSATTAVARPAADGAALFAAKGCATCHEGRDTASLTGVAPSLVQAVSWAGSRRPGMDAEAYLRESITDPSAFVSPEFTPTGPIAAMPGIATSPAELEALVDYLLGPT